MGLGDVFLTLCPEAGPHTTGRGVIPPEMSHEAEWRAAWTGLPAGAGSSTSPGTAHQGPLSPDEKVRPGGLAAGRACGLPG